MNPIDLLTRDLLPQGLMTPNVVLAAVAPDANGVQTLWRTTFSDLAQGMNCACVHTAVLTLSSAEILALNTTPIQFGLNVPAGYFPQIVGDIWMAGAFNGTPYATNTSLRIRSVGGLQNYVSAVNALNFTADCLIPLAKNAITSGKGFELGADLEMYVPTGNPTAGDGTATLYLTYVLIQA